MADRFDNRVHHHGPDKGLPTVRKVPADSVPFGDCISRNCKTVWAAYDARGTLIAMAATADEVRKYRARKRVGVKILPSTYKKSAATPKFT